MSERKSSTRDTILLATIDCIEKHGLEQLTTRMIAEAAGANIAAINYYFRSKDQLIEEALRMTVTHMLEDVIVTIKDDTLSFRETLVEVFYYLIEGGLRWPGITTAHLYSLVVEKQYDSFSGQYILRVFDHLHVRAEDTFPDQDPSQLRLLLSDAFSSVMFKMLTPHFFSLDERYQPEDQARCRRLAEHYAGMFYAQLPHPDS